MFAPPTPLMATGSYDNPFARGMGAAIRTELWACLAPGNAHLAVKYAYEDACMDHSGEGIDAAIFLAALQSLAFVETDRTALIDGSLNYLPKESELRSALNDTRQWWAELGDWRAVRQKLLSRYGNDNFTDVVINLSYILLGFLAGRDFGESICIAVNCGEDTDCTGATLGALLGILDPDSIEERWLRPIGRQLVLSPTVTGIDHPPTLDAFNDLVQDLRRRIGEAEPAVDEAPQSTSHLGVDALLAPLPTWIGDATGLPAIPTNAVPHRFDGTWISLEPIPGSGDAIFVQYNVHLTASERLNLIFCSPSPVRVWWDDQRIISSEGGAFVPALHRCEPRENIAAIEARPGPHTITAVLRLKPGQKKLEWVVGLCNDPADKVCRNWKIELYSRPTTTTPSLA